MFETLLRLWKDGKLSEEKLSNAVSKGWITEEEKEKIMGS